ncbi:hypothetical protein BGZ58_008637 [Dissophora ornata]|nr:hypothetical protein BGZ58_008637 [Dissophora ornata]
MTTSAASGMAGIAKQAYGAVIRIFSTNVQPPTVASHSTTIAFRPRPPTSANQIAASSSAPHSPSISGLKFCLHMVAFAAPGIILSKKLCDGELLEDMIKNTQDTVKNTQDAVSSLINPA